MAIILAILSAVCYGTADFSGGFASRRNSVSAVLVWSQLAGLALVLIFALADATAPTPAPADLLWGAAAGLAGLGGLLFLYRGIARGYVSIVSPMAAVVGAAVPLVFGVLSGETFSTLAGIGISLCLPGIVLMSWNRRGALTHRDPRRLGFSLAAGALAGVFFGLFFIAISVPAEAAGLWPLAVARGTSILILLAAAAATQRRPVISTDRTAVFLAGVLDMSANIFYVLALRQGLLAIVTVITSAYPAQTVLLSRVVLKERVGAVRAAGIALALAGIALMSVG